MKFHILPSLFLTIALSLASVGTVQADFENGLEDFSGTNIDNVTWESLRPQTITQNDELIFFNPRLQVTEHVTRTFGVSVGQAVRAEVTLDNFNTATGAVLGFAALALTDNTSGDNSWYTDDDFSAAVRISVSTNSGSALNSQINSTGRVFHRFDSSILDETYVLELARLTASDVRYAAYDLSNNLIAESTRTVALSDNAFIALASNGSARFDNVEVSAVPEPSTVAVLVGLFCVTAIRRRR